MYTQHAASSVLFNGHSIRATNYLSLTPTPNLVGMYNIRLGTLLLYDSLIPLNISTV
jgi:hypothetical protein